MTLVDHCRALDNTFSLSKPLLNLLYHALESLQRNIETLRRILYLIMILWEQSRCIWHTYPIVTHLCNIWALIQQAFPIVSNLWSGQRLSLLIHKPSILPPLVSLPQIDPIHTVKVQLLWLYTLLVWVNVQILLTLQILPWIMLAPRCRIHVVLLLWLSSFAIDHALLNGHLLLLLQIVIDFLTSLFDFFP
jgi:hypothetical protein